MVIQELVRSFCVFENERIPVRIGNERNGKKSCEYLLVANNKICATINNPTQAVEIGESILRSDMQSQTQ
jgi:hypothetical protein